MQSDQKFKSDTQIEIWVLGEMTDFLKYFNWHLQLTHMLISYNKSASICLYISKWDWFTNVKIGSIDFALSQIWDQISE